LATLIPPFLANAFDRIGESSKEMGAVKVNTGRTADSVSKGGDLYSRLDDLVVAVSKTGKDAPGPSIKEALVLRITGGALKPIGLGLGIIVDALNRAPDGKDLKLKMEALTNGLLALADIGKSILMFGLTMVLALPLILMAGVAMLAIVPILKFMVDGLIWATQKLDKKVTQKMLVLGSIGKALIILGVSFVLLGLLAKPIMIGLAVAAGILLGLGLTMLILDKMKIGEKRMTKFAKMLFVLGKALLLLSVSLIMIGLLAPFIAIGTATAALLLLTLGGVFFLLDKLQIDKSMRKTSKAFMFAAAAILGLSVSLVLSSLLLSMIGWDEIGKVMLVVLGVAVVFAIIGKFGKEIYKGGIAIGVAALAMIVLGFGIMFLKLAAGGDPMELLKLVAIVAAVGLIFAVAGNFATQIALGSAAMILAGAALIVIGLGVAVMGLATTNMDMAQVGLIGAIIVGVGLAFGIAGAGPIPIAIALGSAAMILAGAALIVLGLGVTVFGLATTNMDMEQVKVIGAIIAILGVSLAAAGLVSPLIALGSGAMIIAGTALLVIGAAVGLLANINFKKLFTGTGLFAPSGEKGFFGGNKSYLEVMISSMRDSFSLNPFTLPLVVAGSAAMILVGAALNSIAKGLVTFQKLSGTIDTTALAINVSFMTSILANTFARIGLKYKGGLFFGSNPVSDGIKAVMGMGDALTGIAFGMQNMANLKFPVAYDKDGKPTKFESMDSDAPQRVAANAAMITSVLATVFGDIGTKYPGGKKSLMEAIFGGGKSNPVADGISAVMGMGSALTGIASGFQAMANLNFPTAWDKDGKPTAFETVDIKGAAVKVADNTKLIVHALSGTFADIGANQDAGSSWWGGKSTIQKGIDIVMGIGTPLKNLAQGVSDMANLKFANSWDKDGKAIGWTDLGSMTPKALKQKVGKNTQLLIQALTDTFIAIGGGKSKESSWWQGDTAFEKGISIVNLIGEPYKKLAEAIKPIFEFIDKPFDGMKLRCIITDIVSAISDAFYYSGTSKTFYSGIARVKKAGEIIKGLYSDIKDVIPPLLGFNTEEVSMKLKDLTSAFTRIGDSSDPLVLRAAAVLSATIGKTYGQMADAFPVISGSINKLSEDKANTLTGVLFGNHDKGTTTQSYTAATKMQMALAATYGKAGENFPKISESINAMDLSKLQESRKMFEALAVLSEGGEPADILAAMGDSLEAAMQRLADMLQEFKGSVEENTTGSANGQSNMEKILDKFNPLSNGNSGNSGNSPSIKFPSKMIVTLDSQSVSAIKSSNNFGGGS